MEFDQVLDSILYIGGLPNYIIAMNAQVAKSLRDDPDKADIIDRIPTGKYTLFLFLTGLVAITLMIPLAQVIYLPFTKNTASILNYK